MLNKVKKITQFFFVAAVLFSSNVVLGVDKYQSYDDQNFDKNGQKYYYALNPNPSSVDKLNKLYNQVYNKFNGGITFEQKYHMTINFVDPIFNNTDVDMKNEKFKAIGFGGFGQGGNTLVLILDKPNKTSQIFFQNSAPHITLGKTNKQILPDTLNKISSEILFNQNYYITFDKLFVKDNSINKNDLKYSQDFYNKNGDFIETRSFYYKDVYFRDAEKKYDLNKI